METIKSMEQLERRIPENKIMKRFNVIQTNNENIIFEFKEYYKLLISALITHKIKKIHFAEMICKRLWEKGGAAMQ